jgi:hypothetical protein
MLCMAHLRADTLSVRGPLIYFSDVEDGRVVQLCAEQIDAEARRHERDVARRCR